MERVPDVACLALEKAMAAKDSRPANLRFLIGDARNLTEYFVSHSFDRIYLNFSDPWPKAGHSKRRLTHRNYLARYKQILKEGVDAGIFRIKHIDKAAEILLMAMQGLDVHYIRNSFEDIGVSRLKLRTYLQDFIMTGIKDHHEGTPLNNDNRI